MAPMSHRSPQTSRLASEASKGPAVLAPALPYLLDRVAGGDLRRGPAAPPAPPTTTRHRRAHDAPERAAPRRRTQGRETAIQRVKWRARVRAGDPDAFWPCEPPPHSPRPPPSRPRTAAPSPDARADRRRCRHASGVGSHMPTKSAPDPPATQRASGPLDTAGRAAVRARLGESMADGLVRTSPAGRRRQADDPPVGPVGTSRCPTAELQC